MEQKQDSGYLYIFVDEAFPKYVKVGKTKDPLNRLEQYNSDKPYKSTKAICVSKPFKNVHDIEQKLLKELHIKLTKDNVITAKEWFNIKDLDFIRKILIEYEDIYDTDHSLSNVDMNYLEEKTGNIEIVLFYLETKSSNYEEYLEWCSLNNHEHNPKIVFLHIIKLLMMDDMDKIFKEAIEELKKYSSDEKLAESISSRYFTTKNNIKVLS